MIKNPFTAVIGCLLVSACVIAPNNGQTNDKSLQTASVSEQHLSLLNAAKAAGQKCLIPVPSEFQEYTCSVQPVSFDREACLEFDQAIQSALQPIRSCRESGAYTDQTSRSKTCELYLDRFIQPCIGVHALQMAYADMEASKSYRDALEHGSTQDDARTRYLSGVVRYRD